MIKALQPTAVLVTLLEEPQAQPTAAATKAQGDAEPPSALTGDTVVDHFRPRTELGRTLIDLRRAHVEQGGKLLSWDEIDHEAGERRGGAADD